MRGNPPGPAKKAHDRADGLCGAAARGARNAPEQLSKEPEPRPTALERRWPRFHFPSQVGTDKRGVRMKAIFSKARAGKCCAGAAAGRRRATAAGTDLEA